MTNENKDRLGFNVANVKAKNRFANLIVSALCNGERDWVMSIPARPTYDPDLVISDSLGDIPVLLERIEDLTKERDELKPYEMASLFKDAKIKELEAEVERLRSTTKLLEADNKYCRLATKDYAEQVHSLTKELEKWHKLGSGWVKDAEARQGLIGDAYEMGVWVDDKIKKLEAENWEQGKKITQLRALASSDESNIKRLTTKLADAEKERDELLNTVEGLSNNLETAGRRIEEIATERDDYQAKLRKQEESYYLMQKRLVEDNDKSRKVNADLAKERDELLQEREQNNAQQKESK